MAAVTCCEYQSLLQFFVILQCFWRWDVIRRFVDRVKIHRIYAGFFGKSGGGSAISAMDRLVWKSSTRMDLDQGSSGKIEMNPGPKTRASSLSRAETLETATETLARSALTPRTPPRGRYRTYRNNGIETGSGKPPKKKAATGPEELPRSPQSDVPETLAGIPTTPQVSTVSQEADAMTMTETELAKVKRKDLRKVTGETGECFYW